MRSFCNTSENVSAGGQTREGDFNVCHEQEKNIILVQRLLSLVVAVEHSTSEFEGEEFSVMKCTCNTYENVSAGGQTRESDISLYHESEVKVLHTTTLLSILFAGPQWTAEIE